MHENTAIINEYRSLYREVNGRIAHFVNSYHNDELLLKDAVFELKKINEVVHIIETDFSTLDLNVSQLGDLSSEELELRFERLEKIRLDLIRHNCEVENLLPYRIGNSPSNGNNAGMNANLIHELCSMNRWQLLRIGFFFMLPFIIGVMGAIIFATIMLMSAWGG